MYFQPDVTYKMMATVAVPYSYDQSEPGIMFTCSAVTNQSPVSCLIDRF